MLRRGRRAHLLYRRRSLRSWQRRHVIALEQVVQHVRVARHLCSRNPSRPRSRSRRRQLGHSFRRWCWCPGRASRRRLNAKPIVEVVSSRVVVLHGLRHARIAGGHSQLAHEVEGRLLDVRLFLGSATASCGSRRWFCGRRACWSGRSALRCGSRRRRSFGRSGLGNSERSAELLRFAGYGARLGLGRAALWRPEAPSKRGCVGDATQADATAASCSRFDAGRLRGGGLLRTFASPSARQLDRRFFGPDGQGLVFASCEACSRPRARPSKRATVELACAGHRWIDQLVFADHWPDWLVRSMPRRIRVLAAGEVSCFSKGGVISRPEARATFGMGTCAVTLCGCGACGSTDALRSTCGEGELLQQVGLLLANVGRSALRCL